MRHFISRNSVWYNWFQKKKSVELRSFQSFQSAASRAAVAGSCASRSRVSPGSARRSNNAGPAPSRSLTSLVSAVRTAYPTSCSLMRSVAQNSASCGTPAAAPRMNGSRFTPSSGRSAAACAPAAASAVAATSRLMTIGSKVVPPGQRAGHDAAKGTRMPPSNRLPLPARNGPLSAQFWRAPDEPPLSLRKKSNVFSRRPASCNAAVMRPTL